VTSRARSNRRGAMSLPKWPLQRSTMETKPSFIGINTLTYSFIAGVDARVSRAPVGEIIPDTLQQQSAALDRGLTVT
jgi:hypothetical protein